MQGYPSGDGAVLIKRLPEVRFLLLALCTYSQVVRLWTATPGSLVRLQLCAFRRKVPMQISKKEIETEQFILDW